MNVTFTHNQKQYSGELRKVSGAGNLYHLMVKGIYQGQLVKTDTGWNFSSQQGYNPDLAKLFGERVERVTWT